MLSLADLAALHEQYAEAWRAPVTPVTVGGHTIGDDALAIMGTINLSQDSTYRESVAYNSDDAVRMMRVQAAEGAAMVDLGAESSAIGTATVSPADQARQLVPVIEAVAEQLVVSVESYHPTVVEACLGAGARVLNLTGRAHEDRMYELAAAHDAAVVVCYSPDDNVRDFAEIDHRGDLFPELIDHFGARLERARGAGVTGLLIDPGVGFSYRNLTDPKDRIAHQTRVLAQCFRLREVGVPVCNAMPHAIETFGDQFRSAEGFFAQLAALTGTHLFRVHEVAHIRGVLRALDAVTLTS